VTREFLKGLQRNRALSPATVHRVYSSVRHFARWAHKNADAFPHGCPTDGVRPPEEPEGDWRGLTRANELRLLNAARTLQIRPGRGVNQGLRDHALITVLLGCALRISELLGLDVDQYDGLGFRDVLAKGGARRRFVPLERDGRASREGRPLL
jgi:site-specific recombinase XerC